MGTDPVRPDELTEDAFLAGRLRLRQFRRGHRSGHDAILLAAAVPAHAGDHAIEFGAGAGAAGLALARRVEGINLILVEIDPALVDLAQTNAVANGIAAARITTTSYGKERPQESGSGEDAWARNRNGHTLLLDAVSRGW